MSSGIFRGWWIFLLYGIMAVLFGLMAIFRPDKSMLALIIVFGLLSLSDGLVSLISMFRKNIALPNSLLMMYSVLSVGFGLLALLNPMFIANTFMWLLSLWLILAGLARVVFAVIVRKVVNGEWALALSGLLAIGLGVLFFAQPNLGLVTITVWIGLGALVYGALQIAVALRLRRRSNLSLS